MWRFLPNGREFVHVLRDHQAFALLAMGVEKDCRLTKFLLVVQYISIWLTGGNYHEQAEQFFISTMQASFLTINDEKTKFLREEF